MPYPPRSIYLQASYDQYKRYLNNYTQIVRRTSLISTSSFKDVFEQMSDQTCLQHFRVLKEHVVKLSNIVCATEEYVTSRNRYSTSCILTTCVILSRLATPYRWSDREVMFRKHAPQLSEIFWEGIDSFLDEHENLITGPLDSGYIHQHAANWALSVQQKTECLDNCIGFIDGTVWKIARPDDDHVENVVYNGHKRAHALKYQAVMTPDGIILHLYGPVEGRRHDWTLYTRSEMDGQLESTLFCDGIQYCIYGDSGYNERAYLQVPFQGSNLNPDQSAFNAGMAGARITVEWVFKEVKMYWSTTDFRRKLRVLQAPVGSLYLSAILLTNFRTCLYGNQISTYFECSTPSLASYLRCHG